MAIRRVVLFLALLFSVLQSGCSGLLYHPTEKTYFSPGQWGLEQEELWIGPLHAWRFRSQQKRSRGLVVLFHGNAENLTSHFSSLAWLPREGWDYLIFDYRGYGRSGGQPDPKSTVEDGLRVLNWALSQQVPLVLLGQSLGGAVLLRTLEDAESSQQVSQLERVKLVAIESSFRSYQEAGQSVLAQAWLTWPFQWLSRLLLSDEFAASGQWKRPYSWLVIHGSEDQVVAPRLGRQLFDSLPEPKRWMLTAGGGHIQAFWIRDPRGNYPYREAFLAALDRAVDPASVRPEPEVTFELPFEARGTFRVLQGPGGSFSHQGEQYQAVDFELPEGTPVQAIRGGKILRVVQSFDRGGPSSEFADQANRVLIEHTDGTIAEYFHLAKNSARVREKDVVKTGEVLALSGMSGFCTEPHLHLRVYSMLGSIPMVFRMTGEPGRILKTGDQL